jgi:hypothetical protein
VGAEGGFGADFLLTFPTRYQRHLFSFRVVIQSAWRVAKRRYQRKISLFLSTRSIESSNLPVTGCAPFPEADPKRRKKQRKKVSVPIMRGEGKIKNRVLAIGRKGQDFGNWYNR